MNNQPEDFVKPVANIIGKDSNIFATLSIATKALRRAKYYALAEDLSKRVFNASSYDEALSIILEYIEPE